MHSIFQLLVCKFIVSSIIFAYPVLKFPTGYVLVLYLNCLTILESHLTVQSELKLLEILFCYSIRLKIYIIYVLVHELCRALLIGMIDNYFHSLPKLSHWGFSPVPLEAENLKIEQFERIIKNIPTLKKNKSKQQI